MAKLAIFMGMYLTVKLPTATSQKPQNCAPSRKPCAQGHWTPLQLDSWSCLRGLCGTVLTLRGLLLSRLWHACLSRKLRCSAASSRIDVPGLNPHSENSRQLAWNLSGVGTNAVAATDKTKQIKASWQRLASRCANLVCRPGTQQDGAKKPTSYGRCHACRDILANCGNSRGRQMVSTAFVQKRQWFCR